MFVFIIIVLVIIAILVLYCRTREESKEETIAKLEQMLGVKASITKARDIYIYSFTINGSYMGRNVALSVIYGDEFTLRHSELCEIKVAVPLTPAQKEKYGVGRGKPNFAESLKGLIGLPFSRIHVGAFEVTRMYLLGGILLPSFKSIESLIKIAVSKTQKL